MKSLSKLLLLSLLSIGALGLGACNSNVTPTSSPEQSASQGTESGSETSSGSELDPWVDYVHDGSVQLALEYEGKDFYVDGVGEFELKTCIDGDTAHFTPLIDSLHKGTMKARFYGIDTP